MRTCTLANVLKGPWHATAHIFRTYLFILTLGCKIPVLKDICCMYGRLPPPYNCRGAVCCGSQTLSMGCPTFLILFCFVLRVVFPLTEPRKPPGLCKGKNNSQVLSFLHVGRVLKRAQQRGRKGNKTCKRSYKAQIG